MKRTLIKVTVMGILLAGGIYLMEEKNTSLSDVVLENIEALAAGEGGTSMWFCRGSGSLDCPNGTKVKYIVDNYSLD
ncbi:NVEALA domain-containing protein [Parabacteroides gordonii]|uniref:NVEALA domain-containing protein n=1 Tax=Parabacteroides gordonii TaxID=574930 RepID=UPI0026ED4034|nr:NVEALA domain-containing protein [Parabacteroides gordonii]